MEQKKVIYIAGPITGVTDYRTEFGRYADAISAMGYSVLNPARLPEGMTNAQYMRICFSMIDSADAVLLMSEWDKSPGAKLEHKYCEYTGKPHLHPPVMTGGDPRSVKPYWLREALEEVLNT